MICYYKKNDETVDIVNVDDTKKGSDMGNIILPIWDRKDRHGPYNMSIPLLRSI